jgi:carbon storage regulator CsrA
MEVISRRVNETVVVGEETHITVLKIYDDHVRLAIRSPNQTPCFWEQDVYVNQPSGESQSNWWLNSFRGQSRFDSLRK